MRVCILTTSYPRFQGDFSGIFILELANHLNAKGVEVDIVVPSGEGDSFVPMKSDRLSVHPFNYFFPRRLQKLAHGPGGIPALLKTNRLGWLLLPPLLLCFMRSAYRAAKACDVIHAHWILSGLIGLTVKSLLKKPVIVTLRGTDVAYVKGNPALARIGRFILKRADFVTAVSQDFVDWLKREGLASHALLIPNGVDLNRFTGPSEPKPQEARPTRSILYVGSFIERKGVEYLIKAMPLVLRRVKNARLFLVGEGKDRPKLERMVKDLSLKDSVAFSGAQPHQDLPQWFGRADLLVLPSLNEGRPNVVLEAMASGLPVVASDLGGTRELVDDGETGFLVPPRDVDALAEKITFLLLHDAVRARMSEQARKRLIQKGLTWDRTAQAYIDLYHRLVRPSCAGSPE